jgi:hypothetical protein
MPAPTRRAAVATIVAALLLSSCQLTVELSTRLDGKGGGTFSLAMQMDEELRRQLEGATDPASGVASIAGLFDGLRANGWTVERTEPAAGLRFAASRAFPDAAGFATALDELGSARGSSGPQLDGIKFELGLDQDRSLWRSRSSFRGEFDTSGVLPPDLLQAARGLVRFEIRAELPGSTTVQTGDGLLDDRGAVWRPELGEALTFSAESSALRTSSLLGIMLPALALLAAIAWLLLGRRKSEVPLRVLRLEPIDDAHPARDGTHDRVVKLEPDLAAPAPAERLAD